MVLDWKIQNKILRTYSWGIRFAIYSNGSGRKVFCTIVQLFCKFETVKENTLHLNNPRLGFYPNEIIKDGFKYSKEGRSL